MVYGWRQNFFLNKNMVMLHVEITGMKRRLACRHIPPNTRSFFYVRRNGLYLYKDRIYGIISIYILKGLASVLQLIYILHH